MRLYFSRNLNPRVAVAVARHLNSELEFSHASPRDPAQEAVLSRLNPNRLVPVLVEPHQILRETDAIACRLSQLAESDFWRTGDAMPDMIRWISWGTHHFIFACDKVHFERVTKQRYALGLIRKDMVAEGLAEFAESAAILDNVLKDRKWLTDERVSYAEAARIPLNEYPHINAWHERLNGIDAWRDPFAGLAAPELPPIPIGNKPSIPAGVGRIINQSEDIKSTYTPDQRLKALSILTSNEPPGSCVLILVIQAEMNAWVLGTGGYDECQSHHRVREAVMAKLSNSGIRTEPARRRSRHAVAALLLPLLPIWAAAETPQRPVIVELYTSEGCSSCPPAEALIEEISRQPDVLPLAFHVDYWDHLGWRDRFSMKESTQRQQDLAHSLRLSTIGTPQIIVDGRESVWGANRGSLLRALKGPRSDVPLSAQRANGELIVRTPPRAAGEVYDVYVIGYLPRAVTPIARGENAGRTVTEVNVVRDIRRLGQSGKKPGEWKISIDTFPMDVSRAVVLLQRPGTGAIAGARALNLRETTAHR